MLTLQNAIAIYLAYLTGSLSSAIIVCKLFQLPDPRMTGSKNPGATNVLRIGGKKAALLTLLGDTLKGVIPIVVGRYYGFDLVLLGCLGFAAVLGHLYPIFFKFNGGKGVATALGVLFALDWHLGLAWLSTWIFIAILFRYSSLASLIALALTPLYSWFLLENKQLTLLLGIMSGLLMIRHRANIFRLATGTETKIKLK